MSNRSFRSDERAIEGLPIRLVIALVVGVAALSMMMTILDGVGSVGETEITYEYDEVTHQLGDNVDTTMEVVDENGNEMTDTTVIITSGTAQMDGTVSESTGSNSNEINLYIDSSDISLRQGQDVGTLEVEIIPPSNSDHVDNEENPEIVIHR